MIGLLERGRSLMALRRYVRLTPFDVSTPEGRASERYRRAVLTALALGGGRAISVLATLIAVPLALGYLGPARYGVVVTITAFMAMLVFADLGLGNGLMNIVARTSGEGDRESSRRAISSAFFMLIVVAAALAVILWPLVVLAPWAEFVNISDPAAAAEIPASIAVFVAVLVVNLPLGIVTRVQLAYQQGFVNGMVNAVANVGTLVMLFLAVSLQAPLPWIVLASIGGPLLANVANWIILFGWRNPDLRPRLSYLSMAEARVLIRLGFLFFVLQLTIAVAYQTDVVVAARVLGPEAAATYSVVHRLFWILPTIVNMLLFPLWPAYTEAIARGDVDWVTRTLRFSIGLALLVSGGSSLLLLVAAPLVLELWVGPSIQAPFGLLLGMAIWAVVGNSFNAVAMLLNAASVIRFQVVTALLMAVSSLAASVALAYAFGVAGIVWGTLLAYVACTALPVGIYLPTVLRRLRATAEPVAA